MFRNSYYHIIDYKEIHPIRFWVILIGIITILTLFTYIANNLITKYRNKIESLQNNGLQNAPKREQGEHKGKGFRTVFRNYKVLISVIIGQLFLIMVIIASFWAYDNSINNGIENLSISNSEYVFGIDISHYQGRINWREMRTSHHPIEFVFIRATMGINGSDIRFKENWKKAKQNNYIRGAYHYYRPNENSTKQFENYSKNVPLLNGDFIPILDVEKQSRFGKENLREGVLNWLKLAEKKYGVKPLIYTGLHFYSNNLKGYVDDYPLWIAAYSGKHRLRNVNWTFHQFTEKVTVKGIRVTVDGNDFNGDIEDLWNMCIK